MTAPTHGARAPWLGLVLLWVAGVDVRITLLAVPPVLPLIHRDLGLTETGIAALTTLPVVLFAVAAVPGAFLIARAGARRALLWGILLAAVASGLRGAGTSTAVLFTMTVIMGLGIAITQPAIPSLIGEWLPDRVALATAVYLNGLLVGEMLGAALTLPVTLPLAGGRWEWSFVLWAAFVLATVAAMACLTPKLPDASRGPDIPWWPDWRRRETWQLGFLLGGAAAAYFGSNAFIPDYLRAVGRPQLVGPCLTALNACQLPAPLVAGLITPRTVGRPGPFLAVGLALAGGVGIFLLPQDWARLLGAGALGFCAGFGLVLVLSLPPTLNPRGGVHRLSAGMFAIGYCYSFVAPLLGGVAWDLTRVPAASFLGVGAGAVATVAAAISLRGRDDTTDGE